MWNDHSNKQSHLKSGNVIDISEVFSANKAFLKTDTITQTAITHNKQLSEIYNS